MMVATNSSCRHLLAFLPADEKFDAIEDLISRWLNSPANRQVFDKPATWMLHCAVVTVGEKKGVRIKLSSPMPIIFNGVIEPETSEESLDHPWSGPDAA